MAPAVIIPLRRELPAVVAQKRPVVCHLRTLRRNPTGDRDATLRGTGSTSFAGPQAFFILAVAAVALPIPFGCAIDDPASLAFEGR